MGVTARSCFSPVGGLKPETGGYRDLQCENSYITDPETGADIRFTILFLAGGEILSGEGEASDWNTVHDGDDLDSAHAAGRDHVH